MMVLKCIPLRQHSKFPHLTFSQIVLQPTLLGSARHFPSSLPLGRMLCPLVESYLKPPGDVFYHILCLDLLNLWYNETFERGAISNQYSLCFSTHLYKTKCLGQTFTQARSVCFFPTDSGPQLVPCPASAYPDEVFQKEVCPWIVCGCSSTWNKKTVVSYLSFVMSDD